MLPLRDNIPARHRPVVVWTILACNVLAYLYQSGLDQTGVFHLFHLHGVVPARYLQAGWAYGQGYPDLSLSPLVTHMFLHSGFLHLVMNMWVMWVFADNVEDVMGPARFAAFYLLCGLAALGTHMVFNARSTVPVVGASGAIAGVMGAYFVLYPHARVVTLIPLFFLPYFVELPAVLFLGLWFLMQVFSGLLSPAGAGGGVAWWAHAGGFLAGILLLPFFRDNQRCYNCYERRRDGNDRFFFE